MQKKINCKMMGSAIERSRGIDSAANHEKRLNGVDSPLKHPHSRMCSKSRWCVKMKRKCFEKESGWRVLKGRRGRGSGRRSGRGSGRGRGRGIENGGGKKKDSGRMEEKEKVGWRRRRR